MKNRLILLAVVFACLSAAAQNGKIKTLGNAGFAKAIKNEKVQLVDVRTPEEYAEGFICSKYGIKNFDVKSENFDHQILSLDKSRPVAVYCRSGKRSMVAAEKLSKQGFDVINLKNGFSEWKADTVLPAKSVEVKNSPARINSTEQ